MNIRLKAILEDAFKCKIYRNSLPRGADLFYDMNRCYGSEKNFRVVFDVGANVGQSVISYASAFPHAKIYSFEPVSATFEILNKNTIHLRDRVQLFQVGIGSTQGRINININDDSRLNSIKHNTTTTQETINIDTLDSIIDRLDLNTIDFMKIDIEGCELEAIAGANKVLKEEKVGLLLVEAELVPSDRQFTPFTQLLDAITPYGYKLFGVYEQIPHWSGEKDICYCMIAFVCPKLAEKKIGPTSYSLHG